MTMTGKIIIEVEVEGKKKLNEYLKKLGYLNKYIERIIIECNDGEVAQIKPLLKFK